MAEATLDFGVLIERARLGEAAALAELIQRYEPEVRLVARVLLGRAMRATLDSVDLVQSVHESLLTGLRQNKFDLSSPQQLLGLAVTMVRNKVARHWRRIQRQHRLEAETSTGRLDEAVTALADPGSDPAELAEYQEAVERVCDRLEGLDRRLIELRLEGHSTSEVAKRLGLDPDVLRVRLSRLRRRLRDANLLTEWL